MTARRPSRVMARTPLRMPVTICRKKASSTATAVVGRLALAERPSTDGSSLPDIRGVRALVTTGKRQPLGKRHARARRSELQPNQLIFDVGVANNEPRDYVYVSLARFR